jgi:protease IV
MVSFLRWCKSIGLGVLNGVVKFAIFVVLGLIALFIIGAVQGDGLPSNIVLSLDLRDRMPDSAVTPSVLQPHPIGVMDVVLALDAAERDPRVKGVILRLGSANIPIAQAEELGAAIRKFRASGKFVIAHAQGFLAGGLGDYLTASNADEIWMQPHGPFVAAGEGGTQFFLRGLLDKINAVPQIVKRTDYKSAADQLMEKNMTAADREQTMRLLQSLYDTAADGASNDRHMPRAKLVATLEASPQLAEDARAAGLVDRIGFDDDAENAALRRAGADAKVVKLAAFIRAHRPESPLDDGPKIALVEASGEILDGGAGGQSGIIAGDDMAKAIRAATQDKEIKAILLRVDSPGGSVTASDQILDAVKKAQAAGKPVVVSMGEVAASGGYYISLSADRIVAERGTITGSIGVLTGKISFDRSLALAGIGTNSVGVGHNVLYNSPFQPYTDEQLAALNREADTIYADFTAKVAAGRKMPLAKVQEIAKGRVWSGADARGNGLVDQLGGFWDATDTAKKLAGISAGTRVSFKIYPRQKDMWETLGDLFSGGGDSNAVQALETFFALMESPPVKAVATAVHELPHGGVELRATNLPR